MGSKSPTIPLYKVRVPSGAGERLAEILGEGAIANGAEVGAFEDGLRAYLGNDALVATGDEASSVGLALFMAGVRPGDEVLASPMACLASNIPVLNLFARVAWCDLDPATGSIDLASAAARLTSRTRAILVNHWVGNPSNLAAILAFARQHGLRVIDDAGESLGAEIAGRKLGNNGSDFTVFSFYPNRPLNTIDGGAIAFANREDWERARWLRRFGIHQPTFRDELGEINPLSDIPVAGYNTYLSNLGAGLGRLQLEQLPEIVRRHRENGEFFSARLRAVPGIELLLPVSGGSSSHWVFSFHADNRDGLLLKLRQLGIGASKVHLRNDLYSCFGYERRELPGVDRFARRNLCVPCGWWVSESDRERIVEGIKSGW